MDRRDVPLLTIRLLEMVKWMHSCRLVHGALQPETLMVCHRYKSKTLSLTEIISPCCFAQCFEPEDLVLLYVVNSSYGG